MRDAVTEALRPLPAGYADLFARVLRAAEQDDRIRALWLSGSVGRGVADAGSDLDVALAIAPAAFDDFAATWRDWLDLVTPVVFARELPRLPGSFYSVTPECLRLDVVAERAGSARPGRRVLVFSKDDAAGQAAAAPAEPVQPGPSQARLADLVQEFFRQMAIFPAAVVARQDWLLGVVGVQNAQVMLYQLFVEGNQPLAPMGIKQWSAKLTPRQRQICAELPAPTANRAGVLAAMRPAAVTFRREAKALLTAHGVPWPEDFDEAVRQYWQRELGLEE